MSAQNPRIRYVMLIFPPASCKKSSLQNKPSGFEESAPVDLLGHQAHYMCQINSFLTIRMFRLRVARCTIVRFLEIGLFYISVMFHF